MKKNIPASRDEAIQLLGLIRETTLTKTKLELDYETAVKAIADRYQPEIDAAQKTLDNLTERLHAWAQANPAEFGALKSIECLHGRFGFRLCPPSLRPIKPLTWAKIVDNLKLIPGGGQFLRLKEDVDRQAILANRDSLGPDMLRKIGVRVVQDEEFFVDPKLDSSNP